ncbi:MAG: hydrazine oxidoreductase HzoA, partial [Candidatus Jettenia sp.]
MQSSGDCGVQIMRKEESFSIMRNFLKVTLMSALIGCGAMGAASSLMLKEAKAVEIITHWVPHEVY